MDVEVAYARPDRQVLLALEVEQGSDLEQVIRCSGILDRFPEIDLGVNKVGVFGRICALGTIVRAGDRVEIYRPLIADPKEIRRRRAAKGKPTKKGAGSPK